MRLDLHTHYYPPAYSERIERSGGDFWFGTSPTGQGIIRYRGARFFGVTAPMTDVAKHLEDMDRVGIDTEVLCAIDAERVLRRRQSSGGE